jgi:hypothetical protein
MSYRGVMFGRFTVRPDDEAGGCYGIWDGAVNGWRARGLKDEMAAAEKAVELEIQYDAHGPRPADAVRLLPAPRAVRRATWSDGQIEAWVRDTGTGAWYAKFRDPSGRVSLVLGHDVRPVKDGS